MTKPSKTNGQVSEVTDNLFGRKPNSCGSFRTLCLKRKWNSYRRILFASNYKCIASSNKCLTGNNKKLAIRILIKFLLLLLVRHLLLVARHLFLVACYSTEYLREIDPKRRNARPRNNRNIVWKRSCPEGRFSPCFLATTRHDVHRYGPTSGTSSLPQ